MSQPEIQVQLRRATVDDLPQLRLLWHAEHLDVHELERRFTEFQVAFNPEDGRLLGAMGLHVDGAHGHLHGETFTYPETEEQLRPFMWERIQSVARNHGLARVWTKEKAPFWAQASFQRVPQEDLVKIPSSFGGRHGDWFLLKLREDLHPPISVEKELELFREGQKAETEKMVRQARTLRIVAAVVAALALGALFLFATKMVHIYPLQRDR